MTDGPENERPRTAREIGRQVMTGRILALARSQLREVGPGELSLRAIARELGLASSAIYRYYASRDDLLTALLVQVYDELGQVLEDADRTVPRDRYASRLRALAHALRGWALAHPQDWALLYGSPVPGYRAPQDTVPPAVRATGAFIAVVTDAARAGVTGAAAGQYCPVDSPGVRIDAPARAAVADLAGMLDAPVDHALLLRAMAAWSGMMGAVSAELFGHLDGSVQDRDAYAVAVIDLLVEMSGLRDDDGADR